MTQQEFQERTGITSEAIYELANGIYMEAGCIDKDAFCTDFIKHGDSILLGYFYKTCKELRKKLNALNDERLEMVQFLLQQEYDTDEQQFRDKAVELVGEKEVIRLKIENGWDFCDADKEYIKEHIQ